jgi:hypothetical protein
MDSGPPRQADASFNLELAPRTSRGVFLGDHEGLVAAGNNFDALFAAVSASDPASIFFRNPPPASAGRRSRCVSASGVLRGRRVLSLRMNPLYLFHQKAYAASRSGTADLCKNCTNPGSGPPKNIAPPVNPFVPGSGACISRQLG